MKLFQDHLKVKESPHSLLKESCCHFAFSLSYILIISFMFQIYISTKESNHGLKLQTNKCCISTVGLILFKIQDLCKIGIRVIKAYSILQGNPIGKRKLWGNVNEWKKDYLMNAKRVETLTEGPTLQHLQPRAQHIIWHFTPQIRKKTCHFIRLNTNIKSLHSHFTSQQTSQVASATE